MNFKDFLREYFSIWKYPEEFELSFNNKHKAAESYDHFMNCFLYKSCEIKGRGDDRYIKLKKRRLGTAYMFEMRSELNRKILQKTRKNYFKDNQVLNVFDIGGSISQYTDVLSLDHILVFDLFEEFYEWDPLPAIRIQRQKRPKLLYVKSTATKLPSEHEKAHIVICLELMEHLPLDAVRYQVLREIKRVMKKDGILVFSTPNTKDWVARYKELIKDGEYVHHGIWNYNKMKTALEDNGFKIVGCQGTQLDIHFLNTIIERIPFLIIPLHLLNLILEYLSHEKKLKHQMIILAEKK